MSVERLWPAHIAINEYPGQSPSPPTLLFLHGRLSTGSLWRPLIQRLGQRNVRCLIVDFPGYGSEGVLSGGDLAFMLENLVSELVPPNEQVILVGHDTGAGLAQLFALRAQERIAAMALLNPTCPAQPLPPIEIGYFHFQMQRRLRREFARCPSLPRAARELLLSLWKNRHSRLAMIHAIRVLEDSWPELDERRFWKEAVCSSALPVFLLYGRNDFLIPGHRVQELAQWYPNAQFYERERVGHWPHLEDPDWVAAKLREAIFESGGLRRVRKSLWR